MITIDEKKFAELIREKRFYIGTPAIHAMADFFEAVSMHFDREAWINTIRPAKKDKANG